MVHQARHLEVVGAGPAGLSAAITARAAGQAVTVYEKRGCVGARFHGDFQGIENWSTEEDALAELDRCGLASGIEAAPVRELVCFDSHGAARTLRSAERPIFYLISRGPAEGSLDTRLARQVLSAGAVIRYSTRRERLDDGIVAEGPHAADVIAVGYTFHTDMADGCYGALSEALAPDGYAYLLVHGGQGTLATCLFTDFHRERLFLERTVEFFERHAGLRWRQPVAFGGSGNVSPESTLRVSSRLYAGESAGLQDALFGFGLRYAMLSGHFAARAWLADSPKMYARLWRERIRGYVRTGIGNRRVYRWLGEWGRQFVLRHWLDGGNPGRFLRRIYRPTTVKTLLGSWPSQRVGSHTCVREDCDCTWCRCQSHRS